MDTTDEVPLREKLHEAIDTCTDASLLDLLYTILVLEQSPR